MVRACEKTGLSYQRLERIVEDIEAQIQQSNNREISSQDIGQLVLKYLQKQNEVVYIRFASVYGRFQGITDFVETLNHLKTDTPSSWETDNDALIEEDSTAMLTS